MLSSDRTKYRQNNNFVSGKYKFLIIFYKIMNMNTDIELYKVVAVLTDFSDKNIRKGQVGTVVEKLAENVYEIEFCDKQGQTILTTSLHSDCLLVLDFDLAAA